MWSSWCLLVVVWKASDLMVSSERCVLFGNGRGDKRVGVGETRDFIKQECDYIIRPWYTPGGWIHLVTPGGLTKPTQSTPDSERKQGVKMSESNKDRPYWTSCDGGVGGSSCCTGQGTATWGRFPFVFSSGRLSGRRFEVVWVDEKQHEPGRTVQRKAGA